VVQYEIRRAGAGMFFFVVENSDDSEQCFGSESPSGGFHKFPGYLVLLDVLLAASYHANGNNE
jgi:hypothetical protein